MQNLISFDGVQHPKVSLNSFGLQDEFWCLKIRVNFRVQKSKLGYHQKIFKTQALHTKSLLTASERVLMSERSTNVHLSSSTVSKSSFWVPSVWWSGSFWISKGEIHPVESRPHLGNISTRWSFLHALGVLRPFWAGLLGLRARWCLPWVQPTIAFSESKGDLPRHWIPEC